LKKKFNQKKDERYMFAYLLARVRITDPETYKAYIARSPAVIKSFGGEFLVRGGHHETLEGADFDARLVIVRFLGIDHARAFYHSPEYQELIKLRAPAAIGEIVIVEGFE